MIFCFVVAFALRGHAQERRANLSADLVTHLAKRTSARARVIVSGTDAQLDALATAHHLQIVRRLKGAAVLLANSAELDALAADANAGHLSGDARVRPSSSVPDETMAADQARAGTTGAFGVGALAPVTGKGITVAVVDSGIDTHHVALANKVVAAVSFVGGDPSTDDGYGHGTHVAGIIAGKATNVTPDYSGGIAPGAQLVNVRVLGADGSGLSSDVIAGLEWVISHKAAYNIRIVNLSLGHPVYESCTLDPLCQEVEKVVKAGIVVVAAAGNYCKDDAGQMVLDSIASPGNSPYAITVGAINTWGTAGRSDDTVATFSSRGPTAYDHTAKPDVAAPGVKIVSAEVPNSYLVTTYPATHVAGSGNNAYMALSGTSMAAPMVSGGAALLLQGTSTLTPAQLKIALQSGATYMSDGGLMGAGAGSVNLLASRKIVANDGFGIVSTTIAGERITSSGLAFGPYGLNALGNTRFVGQQIAWGTTVTWGTDCLECTGTVAWGTTAVWGNTITWGTTAVWGNTVAWGTDCLECTGTVAWGTDCLECTGTVAWGTDCLECTGTVAWGTTVVWGNTVTWGTAISDSSAQTVTWGTTVVWGNTVIWDTATDGASAQTITWGTTLTSPDVQ
jgi:serine protease AprX